MKEIIKIVDKYLPQIHQNGSDEYNQLETERLFFANNLMMYARDCVKASLKRAHENADFREKLIPPNNDREYIFFGIDDPDNIVLL